MKCFFYKGILFVLILTLFIQCGSRISDDDIIAKVGNTILTRQELHDRMNKEGYPPDQERTYVDRWIHRQLLYHEALRQHLDQTEDIQDELVRIEKELLINKLLDRTYKEKIKMSEEEIRSYYEQNISDFTVSETEVRIQHILCKSRSDANLALQEINTGEPFDNVAKSRSIDAFASQGGDMGYVKKGDLIPEIERQAFRLSKNQISQVIRSPFGYHIIKVLEHRSAGESRSLAEVQPEIMQRLRVIKEGQVYYDLLYQLQNQNKYFVFQPPDAVQPSDSVQTEEIITD
ncbi:peptidylprolyl isomerase [bacterium]|nr:peptidylprolyl isomerase [bacterium]